MNALAREAKLYVRPTSGGSEALIDNALALVRPLEAGAPGSAIAGGWAAVEALLVMPGDQERGTAASDRLAALVTCSYPRAELTTLAYSHEASAHDTFSQQLAGCDENRERAHLVAEHLSAGGRLVLTGDSDRAAEERMRELLVDPRPTLRTVFDYVASTFRRLYRQRNLILHGGLVDGVALAATLRTAPSLVGAGLDRIAHGWFAEGREPHALAAHAKVQLALVGSTDGRSPVDLLEPLNSASR